MPMHALIVTPKTIDFIEQVNGGVRPAPETLEYLTYFVHRDRLDDTDSNQLMTPNAFWNTYKQHDCTDDNCNIVERI